MVDEIKEAFSFLQMHERQFSLSQIDFVKSLKNYWTKNKRLSKRQKTALFEIWKYINY
jgi:hypothetical protein